MPSAFETYEIYVSIKAHFTDKKYDYHKFRGKVKTSVDSFERRRDKFFFEKLGKKYPKAQLVNFFVANFIRNPYLWIGDFVMDEIAEENYIQWRKRTESLTYQFTEDC